MSYIVNLALVPRTPYTMNKANVSVYVGVEKESKGDEKHRVQEGDFYSPLIHISDL